MSIQIKEIAFVFHPVKDVAAARKFYEGFLGLKLGMQIEFAPGQWWIEYDISGQALAISNGVPAQPQSALTFEVANLDASYAEAKQAGVASSDIIEFPPCRMFQIKDPDGNAIGIHQRKQKT